MGDTQVCELSDIDIRAELQRACDRAGSQLAWARNAGLSPAYVSDILTRRRDITDAVANALGFIRRVRVSYHPRSL